MVEPPLFQCLNPNQPVNPKGKEGQIGKTLRGPIVSVALSLALFFPLS